VGIKMEIIMASFLCLILRVLSNYQV